MIGSRFAVPCALLARQVIGRLLLVAPSMVVFGCGDPEGSLEFQWLFVDQNLERIHPGPARQDSCDLGDWMIARSDPDAEIAVEVRLKGYECADTANPGTGESFPCPASEPAIDARFACDRSRGVETRIPVSEGDAMVWIVELEVDDGEGASFVPGDHCISIPGPRQRKIVAGSITDLELYQFVVHATRSDPLALADCD